ncbi:MAG: hypothetical protein ABL966_04470 [Acidimicrobiales bacterium]
MRRTLLVGALLLAACGGGDDLATGNTTTGATSPTTAPTTTTTAGAPPACEQIFAGSGNPDQVDTTADVDGDGEDDQVHSFALEGSEAGPRFVLQVELAAGGGAEAEIPGDGVATVAIVGGHDLDGDGDGADELWVRVGAGAYATILGLFRLDGCNLERITSGGLPTELAVGSSVGSAIGVECGGTEPGAVLTTFGGSRRSDDDQTFDMTTTEYALEDGALVVVREGTAIVPADDADFQRYITFACGDLTL